jgi:hypothetical protein
MTMLIEFDIDSKQELSSNIKSFLWLKYIMIFIEFLQTNDAILQRHPQMAKNYL